MTKTQRLDAFRNIRKQLVSFLSIVVIAMLAVCMYLGIAWSSEAMDRNASGYYTDRNAQDLQIVSPLLLTEEDLEAVRALDGVDDAEGSLQTVAWLPTANGTCKVSVITMPERIAVPELLDGRLPQTAEECLAESGLAQKQGLKLGDRIRRTAGCRC